MARIAFWASGEYYNPLLRLHLKLEQKKIRNIANSDLVSFVKQTFIYEWIQKSFNEFTRERIYSLLRPTQKVRRVERILKCFEYEKWCLPMDLKDFQD